MQTQIKAFRKENLPAYLAVMSVWIIAAAVLASVASAAFSHSSTWSGWFVFCLIAVMCGMSIMFVASLLNLRKMRPGFERLAAGESDPRIPPVWCPVLTAATNAATYLAKNVRSTAHGPAADPDSKLT
jgi:drug/metabolite transporter (DMT)-like permease